MNSARLLPAATEAVLTARQYAWLALGFLIVVVYGSLVPFHFHPMPLGEAIIRFRAVCCLPVRIESRSDWTANVLLFIPLSYICMAAMSVDHARVVGLLAALLVIPCCALLSAAIEFTQLFFPPRVCSLNDVAAESIGGLLGTSLWLLRGQRITDWGRQLWNGLGKQGLGPRLLPGYLVFLGLIHTMPFDLTISPVELYHKYRKGRVQLVPFDSQYTDFYEATGKNLRNVGYFFPVGLLLSGLPSPPWRERRSWLRVLSLGVGASGLVEFLQLFVYSRFCDATDVITGGGAVLAGWGTSLAYRRSAPVSPWNSAVDRSRAAPNLWHSPFRLGILACWLGLLVFINWQPFDFSLAPKGQPVADRVARLSFVPFADYYKGDYLNSFEQILDKIILFVPLGALLTPTGRWPTRGLGRSRVLLVAVALATTFEMGQLFLPTRYFSITDILIESFGAWLGFAIATRVWAGFLDNQWPLAHGVSALIGPPGQFATGSGRKNMTIPYDGMQRIQ